MGVAVDSARHVYVADRQNHTIRKINPQGVVTTLAGLAGYPGSADGTGSSARFRFPSNVAVDSAGNVYVAEDRIRKIDPQGVVTTLAGSYWLQSSRGVAVDSAGNFYVSEYYDNTILKLEWE
jgi:streptogramin lyase